MEFEKHKDVLIDKPKFCDFCKMRGRDEVATVDGTTKRAAGFMGRWANMCDHHFKFYGNGLGLGVGQRLHVRKPEIQAP